jgi:antitoxin (DNA-binding transcriptional repressor) of toxin-antitoxin stability system
MRVDVGHGKIDFSRLLARLGAGEEVEIARNGAVVALLTPVVRTVRPGERFLAMQGSLAGQIWISDDFELSDEELDEIYDDDVL